MFPCFFFFFLYSTKREIRHFHVVIVQQRLRNVHSNKRDVRQKLLFCFKKPVAFLPLPSPSSMLEHAQHGGFAWARKAIKARASAEKPRGDWGGRGTLRAFLRFRR